MSPWTESTFVHEAGHALALGLQGKDSAIRRKPEGTRGCYCPDAEGVDEVVVAMGSALAVTAYRLTTDANAAALMLSLEPEQILSMARHAMLTEHDYSDDLKRFGPDHSGTFSDIQAAMARLIWRFGVRAKADPALDAWVAERVEQLNSDENSAVIMPVSAALKLLGIDYYHAAEAAH